MNRTSGKIFFIVLLMGLIGVVGMGVLKYNIDTISKNYHEIIDVHAANQDTMKNIMTSLYQHQGQMLTHIFAKSDMYDDLERKEAKLRKQIEKELLIFGKKMQGNEKEQLYHKVYSNYHSYLNYVDIVLDLSRKEDKNMAIYYVNSTKGFLNGVDIDLSALNELTINEMNHAKKTMNQMITISQISEIICICCIVVAVIVCLTYCLKFTTKLENARIEAEIQKQKADTANESKAKFLANMSHEIRTPINAVLGMNSMVLRESKEENIQSYALDIQNAGQTLLALINDILDFSKIESGKMEVLAIEYDISNVIHDVANMITPKAKSKNLNMELYVDETIPSWLLGDDVRLRQILVNLLNNAVKYTESGGITLSIKLNGLEKTADVSYAQIYFEVTDTGIGIKEEDMENLFKEFARIEEEKNRNIEGTGLGMSITTQLLHLMGTNLQVKSEYGKRSTFYFVLKQKVVNEEQIGNLEERIRKQTQEFNYDVTFQAPEARILVVDDNAVNRRVLLNLLKETKVQIDEADSGIACLAQCSQKKYDLILLDHMMPEMDGSKTLKILRGATQQPELLQPYIAEAMRDSTTVDHIEYYDTKSLTSNQLECLIWNGSQIPIVILTANAISGAREHYLQEGFDGYLSKPIYPEKLEQLLLKQLPEEKLVKEWKKSSVDSSTSNQNIELPELEGIDLEYALLHTGNNTEILLDTIKQYLCSLEQEAEKIKQLYLAIQSAEENETEAMDAYRIQVHSMKASAAMVGSLSVSGLARTLEYAARDYRKDIILALSPIYIEEWKKQKEVFQPMSAFWATTPKEQKTLDFTMLKEYLKLLDHAMEDMDIDTADNISEQLQQYTYPEELQSKLEEIYQEILQLNGERIHEIIVELRSQNGG